MLSAVLTWKSRAFPTPVLGGGLVLLLLVARPLGQCLGADASSRPERPLNYFNDVDPKIPWSAHVVKVERSHPEFSFRTTLGEGQSLGMSTVAEQIKALPRDAGQPLAAINGDYYEKSKDYPGCPRDLQIWQGEVVSDPAGHNCFWVDATGTPRFTNVWSRFRVTWPNGVETAMGLNRQRTNNQAMLYTTAIGKSTRTTAGTEYVLERGDSEAWLPLRAGQKYSARVRAVKTGGNTPLEHDTLVLSLSPELMARLPALAPGATVKLATETVPDVAGADFAIGGGPTLLRDGKSAEWGGWVLMRHPHTALGWNKTHYFLVVVDGRQIDVSLGMTFPELAQYMLKLGCEQAMCLDGGGSATLWALGNVRNSPSEGQERPAPNALVVVKKSVKAQTP